MVRSFFYVKQDLDTVNHSFVHPHQTMPVETQPAKQQHKFTNANKMNSLYIIKLQTRKKALIIDS